MENPAGNDEKADGRIDWTGRAPRLFVQAALAGQAVLDLDRDQARYLGAVLRLGEGADVLLFNGRDGEWRAAIAEAGRKSARLVVQERTRAQSGGVDLDYLFAPLKHARLDYMVQKATEMGVRRLRPVLTRRTVPSRVNLERMRANVVEAAEQCGVLAVPDVLAPARLSDVLQTWDPLRTLVFADEAAAASSPLETLAPLRGRPLALLVGPEGGFETGERQKLLSLAFVVPVSLGPRILRADTAAVAALALLQAAAGDWPAAEPPRSTQA